MMTRPTRDQYWMDIAHSASTLSTCSRLQVGAALVRDDLLLSVGRNGAPRGLPHCVHTDDTPCHISEHAERNAVTFARQDVSGSTLYVTHAPCYDCSRTLINAGITSVKYRHVYRSDAGLTLLESAGIATERKIA